MLTGLGVLNPHPRFCQGRTQFLYLLNYYPLPCFIKFPEVLGKRLHPWCGPTPESNQGHCSLWHLGWALRTPSLQLRVCRLPFRLFV